MYRLKYRVSRMKDTICIVKPIYQYNQYITIIRYRALVLTEFDYA